LAENEFIGRTTRLCHQGSNDVETRLKIRLLMQGKEQRQCSTIGQAWQFEAILEKNRAVHGDLFQLFIIDLL
jgi:hypothetical protein